MDVKIINEFLTAGMNAFQTMFGIEATNKEPYILKGVQGHPWEVSGILGVTGDCSGVVAFRLHRILSLKMLELAGMACKPEEQDEMAKGLVSEFTNIISGNAVSALTHVNLDISPPVTISGKDHVISWPTGFPVIAIPFSTKYGPFEVDVCFK
ncbi:MAG: chemotaxis protein CheX [Treponema sp.]|nr:chemotaxis protein CheX [Candidatus Treponema caballi]